MNLILELKEAEAKEELQHTAKHPVTLWSIEAQWMRKYVEARADIVSGNIESADTMSSAVTCLPLACSVTNLKKSFKG